MKNRYFEDFEIGASHELGSHKVTSEEIIEFASKYDPQPFHLSEEGGAATHFGGLIASGWQTCAIAMRMVVDTMPEENSGAMGSPGIDELRWTKPVFSGDTLNGRSTVIETKPSRSRPDMGTIKFHNEVFNQKQELVLSYKPIVMYKRRP